MIKSVLVSKPFKDFAYIKKLYDSSFPRNERIPFMRLYRQLDESHVFYAYYDNDEFIGLSFLFLHGSIAYLSYLAVKPEFRNQGYGGQILELIKQQYATFTIVIDIEEAEAASPNYEERVQRRAFYLRHGFASSSVFYSIFNVDYELLSFNGTITAQQWQQLITAFWGKYARLAQYH